MVTTTAVGEPATESDPIAEETIVAMVVVAIALGMLTRQPLPLTQCLPFHRADALVAGGDRIGDVDVGAEAAQLDGADDC